MVDLYAEGRYIIQPRVRRVSGVPWVGKYDATPYPEGVASVAVGS
jgi:hypothetical protein